MSGKISGYTAVTEIADADLVDVSVDAGGGTFVTRSITGADLKKVIGGFRLVKTVDYTEISAAALTNNVLGYSLPAKYEIRAVWLRVKTAFVGTGITSLDVTFGISGDEDKYVFPFNCLATGKKRGSNPQIESESSATSLNAYFTSVGANLDQLTAGELEIYVETVKVI